VGFALPDLVRNGGKRSSLTKFRSPAIAIDAPAKSDLAVPVRTGKARVDGQLEDVAAEGVSPVAFQVVVSFPVVPECRFGQGRLFFSCFFPVILLNYRSNCNFFHAPFIRNGSFLSATEEALHSRKA
jgi:hypothetical protein